MPFLKETYDREPAGNFSDSPTGVAGLYRTITGEKKEGSTERGKILIGGTGNVEIQKRNSTLSRARSSLSSRPSVLSSRQSHLSSRPSVLENGIRNFAGRYSDGTSLRLFNFLVHAEKPSDEHGLHDIEINGVRLLSLALEIPEGIVIPLTRDSLCFISTKTGCHAFSGSDPISTTRQGLRSTDGI